MQLTEKNISDFQQLYKQLYNIELSKEEAYDKGLSIVNLLKLIYKPIAKTEFEELKPYFKEWESEIAALEAKTMQ